MSLNWNIENVKADWKSDDVWPITDALIWATMSVGMNEITNSNWREFYSRAYMIQTIHGGWIIEKGKTRFVTPQEVKDHIGLYTNATNYTAAKFKSNIDRRMREYANQHLRMADEAEQEEAKILEMVSNL
jgi:hypothetical protein